MNHKENAIVSMKEDLYEVALSDEYEIGQPIPQPKMTDKDRSALAEYQKENSLKVTGYADRKTLERLHYDAELQRKKRGYRCNCPFTGDSPIRIGDQNGSVAHLQCLFRDLARFRPCDYSPKDGICDECTVQMIRDYQRYFGFPETGEVDETFMQRLESELRARKAFGSSD